MTTALTAGIVSFVVASAAGIISSKHFNTVKR